MLECAIMAVLFRRLQSGSQRGNGHGSPLSIHDGDGERRKLHPPAARALEASIIIQTGTVARARRVRVLMAKGGAATISALPARLLVYSTGRGRARTRILITSSVSSFAYASYGDQNLENKGTSTWVSYEWC